MINFIKYQKITNWKNHREKVPIGKIVREIEILKLLDQGLYAQEIVQKISLSQKKLSRIINSFKERGLILQTKRYPKLYQSTNLGKIILEQGDLKQKRIQEYIKEEKTKPSWLKEIRVHKLRFKNKLIHKPSWLNRVRNVEMRNGFSVKRIELKNWTKFLLTFNYQDFDGLEKIEVCNNVIIYNFNRIRDEQYVSSNESLENYFNARIEDCKKARAFIQQRGFEIDNNEPEFCQKPDYAIETHGDPRAFGSLGQYMNISIKTSNEIRKADDSPKNGGEEETNDIEKVKSYFDMPNELEDMNNKLNTLNEKVNQALNKEDLDKLEAKMVQMNNAMISMANGVQRIAETIAGFAKQSKQGSETKAEIVGGMYQ